MKKVLFVLLVLAVLTVSACNSQKTPTKDTYIGGTQGLEISFLPGSPPTETSDGGQDEFDVIVQVKNEGETFVDKDDVTIELSGFPPQSFGKSLGDMVINPDDDVEAKIKNADNSITLPPPVFGDYIGLKYNDYVPGTIQFPVKADICYSYETRIASDLCIKDDLNKDKDDDFCTVSSQRALSSSGAPVQVTNIKQAPAGTDKTRFTFNVINSDNGDVFREGSGCDDQRTNEKKVWVEVNDLVGSGAGTELRCTGLRDGDGNTKGYVTIYEDGTLVEVSCLLTIPDRNDRLQPFNINLTYEYQKSIQTTIDVVHNP